MSSKLDPHEDLIIQGLQAGHTYVRITKELENLGCKTSAINLSRWVKCRAKRSVARQQLINPQAFFAPAAPIPAALAAAVPAAQVPRAPALAPVLPKKSDPGVSMPVELVRNEAGHVILPPAVGHRPSHTGAPVKSEIKKRLEALELEDEQEQLRLGKLPSFSYTPSMAAMAKLGEKGGTK